MRFGLFLLALLPLSPQVDRPLDVPAAPSAAYPLRLHILVARQGADAFSGRRAVDPMSTRRVRVSETAGALHGYGTANLDEPSTPASPPASGGHKLTGVEYAFDCAYGLTLTGKGDAFYPARWVKPGSSLEVLMQRAGADKTDTCTVNVTLKARPYDVSHRSTWHSALLGSTTAWVDPDVAWAGSSPDYPVRLRVVDVRFRDSAGGVFGSGAANLLDGPRGALFTFNCDRPLTTNSQPGEFYLGHWVRPDAELEVLQQRIGSAKVDRCRLRLTLQPSTFPDPS